AAGPRAPRFGCIFQGGGGMANPASGGDARRRRPRLLVAGCALGTAEVAAGPAPCRSQADAARQPTPPPVRGGGAGGQDGGQPEGCATARGERAVEPGRSVAVAGTG